MRRIWLSGLVALMAASAVTACGADDDSGEDVCHPPCLLPYGGMAIIVRDATSDVPITGVTVSVVGPTAGELECSPYVDAVRCDWFDVVPLSGHYEFIVKAPGFKPALLRADATVTNPECGCMTGSLSRSEVELTPAKPSCEEVTALAATGCITDEEGAIEFEDLSARTPTSVKVTALDRGDPRPTACGLSGDAVREFVLRADDDREWRYFVSLPGLPADVVEVGDELDLFADTVLGCCFTHFEQSVLLARSGELVLFTVNGGYFNHGIDLEPYGATAFTGEPYCSLGDPGICGGTGVLERVELLVTRGSDEASIRPGETQQVGTLSVSVEENYRSSGSRTCDPPPGKAKYGGFVLRE